MQAKCFIMLYLQSCVCHHIMSTFYQTANNQAVNTEHCILFHKTDLETSFVRSISTISVSNKVIKIKSLTTVM